MHFAMEFIPVTQKASNVCAYCKVRKQKCDRTLPRCERCAVKGRNCDYTPYKEPPRLESHELEPHVVHYDSCSHVDLSPRGTTELLQAVTACLTDASDPVPVIHLTELVQDILDFTDANLPTALEEFGPCIQHWCPILFTETLRGGANDLSQQMSNLNTSSKPLLWLCLWLVTRRTCYYRVHINGSELYRTLKQIVALMQTQKELRIEVFQIGMLISIYEFGHGLQIQAHQTLGGIIALLRMLELSGKNQKDRGLLETINWMQVSALMLDRLIPTSMTNDPTLITISSTDPISKKIAGSIGSALPHQSVPPYATSTRKVYIRAAVSLAAGHVQEYIHARRYNLEPAETYDKVDDTINACIKQLVERPEPHLWQNCDGLIMAFCSHILLQASQVQYLRTVFPGPHIYDTPTPAHTKAQLALQYSRRMTWDMVRMNIKRIRNEAEMPHLPFAGLCSVFRAGLAVFETSELVDEKVVNEGEARSFQQLLEWFAGRWGIGYEYLGRLEELLGQLDRPRPELPDKLF